MSQTSLYKKITGHKKFIYSLADQFFVVGIILIVNIMLARMLSKQDYGAFVLSYSIFTFMLGIYNGLILEAYTVFSSGKYKDKLPEYINFMFMRQALLASLMAAGLLIIITIISNVDGKFHNDYFIGVSFAIPILFSAQFIRRTYYTQELNLYALRQSMLAFIISTTLLYVLYATNSLNGLTIFIAITAGNSFAISSFIFNLLKQDVGNDFFLKNREYNTQHYNFSKWVLLTGFVFQLSNQGYIWLAAAILDMESLAIIKTGQLISAPLEQIFIVIFMINLPKLSALFNQEKYSEYRKLLQMMLVTVLIVGAFFLVIILMASKGILSVIFGLEYKNDEWILFYLIISTILNGAAGCFNLALKSIEKSKSIFIAYAVTALTTVSVGIPLVYALKLYGVALGIILSSIIHAAAMFVQFNLKERKL